MVINNVLIEARDSLNKAGIDPREARLLLAYSMGISKDELIKYAECSDKQYEIFLESIKRRIDGEPFSYITGTKEFMKLNFKVNKYTLIPREDTEILVQEAIDLGKIKILDMCTGSGCIAVSLAKYIKDSKVDAVDVSKDALNIAKENAKENDVFINFIESNLFEKVTSKYELIVSNPPYIPREDIKKLQVEVKNEPKLALDGGEDGLDFYRIISKEAKKYLCENGVIMFEIGFNQALAVLKILEKEGFINIKVVKDLSGNDRAVVAERGV